MNNYKRTSLFLFFIFLAFNAAANNAIAPIAIIETDQPHVVKALKDCNTRNGAYSCLSAGQYLEGWRTSPNTIVNFDRAMAAYTRGCQLGYSVACIYKNELQPSMNNPYALYELKAEDAIKKNIAENCWESRIGLDRLAIKSKNPEGRALVYGGRENDCLVNGIIFFIGLKAYEVSDFNCVDPEARNTQCEFMINVLCFTYTPTSKKLPSSDPRVADVSNSYCGVNVHNRKATGEILTDSDGTVSAKNVIFLDGY